MEEVYFLNLNSNYLKIFNYFMHQPRVTQQRLLYFLLYRIEEIGFLYIYLIINYRICTITIHNLYDQKVVKYLYRVIL
jgi:hypothetical protein